MESRVNPHQHGQPQPRPQQSQFESFTASTLYCEKCRATPPVRERLPLVLPDKEIFDYLCTECGSSIGQREVTAGEKMMAEATQPKRGKFAFHFDRSDNPQMRIVFIGTGEIGVPTLRALQKAEHELVGIVTQPDKPVGREQKITAPPIKAALSGTKISILQPAKINDSQAIEQIRALAPDLIVVMAYGQILPRAALEIPKIACLNLHASLLPRWRGAAPIQAAIAAGDRETGITVMSMHEGLDTGDIVLQRKIDILPSDTGGSLHDRLAQIAPEALLESLRMLAAGGAPRVPPHH